MREYNHFIDRKETLREMMRTRLKWRPGMRSAKKLANK